METPEDPRITLEELTALIADPERAHDLSEYFITEEDAGEAFDPVVRLNPARVHVPDTPEGRARSALFLNGANWLERNARQARFYRRIASGRHQGPIIVEEGDSWFQYPFRLWDIIDVLMEHHAILSLSAGGDTLENMARKAEYRKALRDTGASILLLSGGGNDLVANGNLAAHLRDHAPARRPEDYLLPSFDQVIAQAIQWYDRICHDVARHFPGVRVICHGYDYPVPNKGRWLGRPMARRGITDPGLQAAIARIMCDRFHAQMTRFAARHRHVRFLDLRGTVDPGGWFDELHPRDPGYRKAAAIFDRAIAAVPAAARAAPPDDAEAGTDDTPPPKALSLHLVVNRVDRDHYGDAISDLAYCHADAESMAEIALREGFSPTVLLDDQATRAGLHQALCDAADRLVSGDILFLSYAGHGSQIPDFNGDERDGPDGDMLDETLCLHDGQFVDDELFVAWSRFAEGVRIVAVFDSCHSGSVVRNPAIRPQGMRGTARRMTFAASAQVFRRNEAFYRGLPGVMPDPTIITRELNHPMLASLIQLSACQSNQLAMEVDGNGMFTRAFRDVWERPGHRWGYGAFLDRVTALMPPEQTPKMMRLGPPDRCFERQMVLAV